MAVCFGCDAKSEDGADPKTKEARAAPSDPLEGMLGIYTVESAVESKEGCSLDAGEKPFEQKEQFFYVAPRINPFPHEKELKMIGMIASCPDLETCRANAKKYVETGATPLGRLRRDDRAQGRRDARTGDQPGHASVRYPSGRRPV
ncbi:MAG: hypothetical protein AAGA54_22275 [Myxococcota bacterium]